MYDEFKESIKNNGCGYYEVCKVKQCPCILNCDKKGDTLMYSLLLEENNIKGKI